MGKLVITEIPVEVCRDVLETVRRGKQTSWAPPIQVAQKSVFSKSSSGNSKVALEGLPNLNQAGGKFWESLSRGADIRTGNRKNEGYPWLKENCSKKDMKEPLVFGNLLVRWVWLERRPCGKGYTGRMTIYIITQTRTLLRVKRGVMNHYMGNRR